MKTHSLKSIKKKAWAEFSKYIRLKSVLKDGVAFCFTCSSVFHWKELQAGHFIDGRKNAVLYDEEIVHPQCQTCNIWKRGNKDAYTPRMIEKYGLKKVKEMWARKEKIVQMKYYDHEIIYLKYKQLNEKLESKP